MKNYKEIVRIVGNIIVVITFGFILKRLISYRRSIIGVWSNTLIPVLLLSVIAYGSFIVVSAILYTNMAEIASQDKISRSSAIRIYGKANLYKYLPGNVMHLVGKNQIAVENNIPHALISSLTVIEMMLSCLGSLTASFLLSQEMVKEWMRQHLALSMLIISAGMVCCTAVLCIFVWKKRFFEKYKELFMNRRLWRAFAAIFLFTCVNQLIGGYLFVVLLVHMTDGIPESLYRVIAGTYDFAWLAGFVTPGAPGGLGIREAMLSVLLSSYAQEQIILAATILNRIATTFGDILGFLLTSLFSNRNEGK